MNSFGLKKQDSLTCPANLIPNHMFGMFHETSASDPLNVGYTSIVSSGSTPTLARGLLTIVVTAKANRFTYENIKNLKFTFTCIYMSALCVYY